MHIEMRMIIYYSEKGLMSSQEPRMPKVPPNSPSSDISTLLVPSPGFCTKCPLPHAPYCAYDGSQHRVCDWCGHFSLAPNHACPYMASKKREMALQRLKRTRSPTPSPSPVIPSEDSHSPSVDAFEEQHEYAHLEKD